MINSVAFYFHSMTLIVGTEEQVTQFVVIHMPSPTEEQMNGSVMLYEMDFACFKTLDRVSLEIIKKLVICVDENPLDTATYDQMEIVLNNGGLVVEVDI